MKSQTYQSCSMGDLIITAIQRGGDRDAFVWGDLHISYREMGRQLSQIIQVFEGMGLQHGETVATLSTNRPHAFFVSAAAYVMGLRVVWMNPMSSPDDHLYQVEDAQVQVMVVEPATFGDRALKIAHAVNRPLSLLGLGAWAGQTDLLSEMVLHTPQILVSRSREDDHCALLYTGGTTGKPKGVLHTHRVMVAMVLMQMADFDWPNLPRFLAMTPITHAAGALIPPVLMRSGTVIMHAGFDVKTFCSLVEKHRVNCTFMVPTMIYVLLDSPVRQDHDLSSLETLIYGAASMAPARLIEGIAEFGPIFMQLYGQSEAPMAMTVLHKHEHDPVNHPQRLSSCGTPVVGIQLDLLDEDGQPVQTGEVGEICVRGPLVMQEYINKPKENAQAFRHGWLYSGDLARRDADGYLYIVDRSKDMIISGGFNVYPREIEDVLSTHPSVAAVAVVGVPHDKWGEAVHAVVVWRAGQSADWGELAEQVRAKKGAIHVPKYFHAVDHLLTTGLGKVDKKAIRQQVQNLP
jgi:fatty-acyl-CoA synthase